MCIYRDQVTRLKPAASTQHRVTTMSARIEVIQIQQTHRLLVGTVCECGQSIQLLLHRTTPMTLHTKIDEQTKRILWQATKAKHTCIRQPLDIHHRPTCSTTGNLAILPDEYTTWCRFAQRTSRQPSTMRTHTGTSASMIRRQYLTLNKTFCTAVSVPHQQGRLEHYPNMIRKKRRQRRPATTNESIGHRHHPEKPSFCLHIL